MDRQLIIVQMGWPLIVVLEELISRKFYTTCSVPKLTTTVNKMSVHGKVTENDVETELRLLETAGKVTRIKTDKDDCFEIPINRVRTTAA